MTKISSQNIDQFATAELDELNAFLSMPSAYSDPDFSKKNRRLTEIEIIIEKTTLRTKTRKSIK